ncbi:MAG: MetS family NSS transporter small subunit [Cytophagia bacterium]|nr:MetS family NSS transporter small subunit [Cytophagia bacterium]NVK85789.1 MetS family NSS transporter small subunit [Cytophagia bacterium]
MSGEAIIGMIICLTITVGGFLVFLKIALNADKKEKKDTTPNPS